MDADPAAGAKTLQVAHLDVYDVKLTVVFEGTEFDAVGPLERQAVYAAMRKCSAECGVSENLILVWQDAQEITRFLAAPQQHPFLQTIHYDQLRAQVNGSLLCLRQTCG